MSNKDSWMEQAVMWPQANWRRKRYKRMRGWVMQFKYTGPKTQTQSGKTEAVFPATGQHNALARETESAMKRSLHSKDPNVGSYIIKVICVDFRPPNTVPLMVPIFSWMKGICLTKGPPKTQDWFMKQRTEKEKTSFSWKSKLPFSSNLRSVSNAQGWKGEKVLS